MQPLNLIPQPHLVDYEGESLVLDGPVRFVLDSVDPEDRFALDLLRQDLADAHHLTVGDDAAAMTIRLGRGAGEPESYVLTIRPGEIAVIGADAAGAYYATQTLRQCLRREADRTLAPVVRIVDRPDLAHRALHYDTKHHQDTFAYVQSFIREIAHYKANILVWEWEDKLQYEVRPEIGAPGAFTVSQMQELTRYARQHHVEIVPLVQGLGHVPFILKHKHFRHLREIPASDWEFCPLNEGSYELLFELWTEAMAATPGSRFFHIGSDETYELGLGTACGCADHARVHGKDSLMRLFIDRCVDWVEAQGRICLSWGGQWKPGGAPPRPTMIWTDGDKPDVVKASAAAGYPCWIYAPNTGVTPLVVFSLPWVKSSMWHNHAGQPWTGGFAMTSTAYSQAIADRSVTGSITTSWDDSGLHNQMWMPHFICGCEFSWNGSQRPVDEWAATFFANYFGPQARHMHECQALLQECALFYDDTFQRRVWHWGDVGKMHLPDLPRAGLEYDLFWRRRYALLLRVAAEQRQKLERCERILDANLAAGVKHAYDLEVMLSCVRLMRHNVDLISMLGALEARLEQASYVLHDQDRHAALRELRAMEGLIEAHLVEREQVYADLVACWERTRLPKGFSTPSATYFWKPERARHFANRTADLRYLVVDEDLLGLEDYLVKLRAANDRYAAVEVDA